MKQPHLQHFIPLEFGKWYEHMSPRQLVMLDVLRHRLGTSIEISAHPKALGRMLGEESESAHNIDFWGEVKASDCFVKGVYFRAQALNVVKLATEVGFTGIGVYPHWTNNAGKTQPGFHFDTRPNRSMGSPATWGFFAGKQVSLEVALNQIPLTGGNPK